ncbi:LOW QUALITY PROTEIN: ankyrin repeat domain-containing protein 53 [Cebus imitator]|uniref:LOW QUALITY PROTEIN: ankyrin repeat domain-containing protein 53 n=1 Tax=Cebus imitator TaxID=2715852 RepID=UPI00189848FC|nr:LOW QUALITY PROTEIN: ankyrin repeat domain-containing protein 53 [Cebus imitator]
MSSAGSTARRAGSGSWHSERGEGRGTKPQPAPLGSVQGENKVSLKATWTDEESKQPSPPLPGLANRLRAQATALATRPPAPALPLSPPCADPSPSKESDQTAIHQTAIHQTAIRSYYQLIAAAVGNVEWLRFCLNQSLGEIPTNNKGFTAIHFAAQRGKLACLQVLVEEFKFPVDLLTNDSQTPLHLVIHRDNTSVALPCIYYLLEKGAALNVQTCNGSTPLHLAAREGLLDCVKVLVQSGANVHAQDAMGYKPIDFCKIWNHRACARFLKDAMWKKDKKDFAREMGKMKTFKRQLALMEHNYLIEYQKEHKILKEAAIRKWLHSKLHPGHSLVSNTTQARVTALSKTPEQRRSQCSRSFQPSVEMRLQCMPQPTEIPKPIYRNPTHPSVEECLQRMPQPTEMPKPIYRNPTVKRPMMWNVSNNPARSPITQISHPQGIRLGVHPDPSPEHDFSSFLEVTPDGHGGAQLHTVDGHWVAPVPRLPFEVILRTLYPRVWPYRMKVPQGFYPISMRKVPRKRHLGNDTFWTDTLTMNLRDTFDEAFLAAVRSHQGLPALPCPQTHP